MGRKLFQGMNFNFYEILKNQHYRSRSRICMFQPIISQAWQDLAGARHVFEVL